MENFQDLVGKCDITISEAMQRIDNNSYGIVFFIDECGIIRGCMTDGDIRRYLLSGGKMNDLASKAFNKSPKVAYSLEEARALYHKRDYIVIPIVNKIGHIIDFFTGESGNEKRRYNRLSIPVVINAGGKGTRLDPYTRVLPKPLIPVGELPIIELIMKEYQNYDCNDFHIIVNYKKELMKAYFNDNDTQYNITWYDELKPLGTGGGLSLLRNKINSTFFFANCDALLTANYESILKFHNEQKNCITMVCAYKNINIPYGVVEMGEQGVIKAMKEKPLFSFLTNTGIYIVEPEVIDDIDDEEVISFPNIVLREKKKGRKVAAFPVSETEWMDMGQLPELDKMRAKLYGE